MAPHHDYSRQTNANNIMHCQVVCTIKQAVTRSKRLRQHLTLSTTLQSYLASDGGRRKLRRQRFASSLLVRRGGFFLTRGRRARSAQHAPIALICRPVLAGTLDRHWGRGEDNQQKRGTTWQTRPNCSSRSRRRAASARWPSSASIARSVPSTRRLLLFLQKEEIWFQEEKFQEEVVQTWLRILWWWWRILQKSHATLISRRSLL